MFRKSLQDKTNNFEQNNHSLILRSFYYFKLLVKPESYHLHHHHQCSAQGHVFHCKLRHLVCSSAQRQVFYRKLRNQGCSLTRDEQVRQLSTPHSFFSICTDLKRSEKIPGTPARRRGEWICLTGPSRAHRNSTQGLNISSIRVFGQIRNSKIPITLCPVYISVSVFVCVFYIDCG